MKYRNRTARSLHVKIINAFALLMVAMLIAVVICWLALTLSGQQPALIFWLALMQPWLQLWRLLIYFLIALFWCNGIRRQMLQVTTYWQVRRLELLMLMLWVTTEGALWARILISEVAL